MIKEFVFMLLAAIPGIQFNLDFFTWIIVGLLAGFFASVFAGPRRRSPFSPLVPAASGGNSPKFTFMGW